jgi:hypothetical protein
MTKKTKEETKEIKPQTARYISQSAELKLINKASYTKEVEGRIVVVPGKSIQFHNGVYETKDPDEIRFLENHPNFGNLFYRLKGKEDAQTAREERFKDLEAREKALAEKEAKLKEREMAVKGHEEGAKPSAKGIRGTESTKPKKPKF